MKTAALKINSYAKNIKVVNCNNDLRRKILNIFLGSFGILIFCYILFLGSMVSNILERKGFENELRSLTNEVSDLEVQYLLASNKVDLSLAQSMGFKETKAKQFTTRKSLGSVAFMGNEL